MMPKRSVISTLAVASLSAGLAAQDDRPHAGLFVEADVSATHIVFGFANNLYLVEREGGEARVLTTPRGRERFPQFSPDGNQVAFLGNYESNSDLHVLAIDGSDSGIPRRLTHHSATEIPQAWIDRPGNETDQILFFTQGMHGNTRASQLFFVDIDGGLPEQLPLPYGTMSDLAPDGKTLAYTPETRDFRTWKRYTGGNATDIWLLDLETYESTRVTDFEGTDTQPMFVPNSDGQQIYYLSDGGENHRINLWRYNRNTSARTQLTEFEAYDIQFASMGPGPNGRGEVVMQVDSSLYLYDIARDRLTEVEITIPGDRPTLADDRVNFAQYIKEATLSPDGTRIVLEARGDIFTIASEEEGIVRHLVRDDLEMARSPIWSPDGKHIAYLSDHPDLTGNDGTIGEYEIFLIQSDGKEAARKLTDDGSMFRFLLGFSPDSEKLAFATNDGTYSIIDIESGDITDILTDAWAVVSNVSWSHDSAWLALETNHSDSSHSQIALYEVATGTLSLVTSEYFSSSDPVFDHEGDFLYFISSRHFSPTYGQVEGDWIYNDASVIHAVPLREDVDSPFLEENPEVIWEEEEDDSTIALLSGGWTLAFSPNEDNEDESTEVDIRITDASEARGDGDEHESGDLVESESDDAQISMIELNEEARTLAFRLTVDGQSFTITISHDEESGETSAIFENVETGDSGDATLTARPDEDDDEAQEEDEEESLQIDLDGFESRAMRLPIPNGRLRNLGLNDQGHLIYIRGQTHRGTGSVSGIKLFDIENHEDGEKSVLEGSIDIYRLSPDGTKILAMRGYYNRTGGTTLAIMDAKPGQSFDRVDTSGMVARINPREEWQNVYTDTWRIFRDFFYEPGMHGVDWRAVYDQYFAMLKDAVNRHDVTHISKEMISELNIGHAYYSGGDLESASPVRVGHLGAEYEFVEDGSDQAYRITRILKGGPWDTDARGPLSEPGIKVEEGEYLLAINGELLTRIYTPYAALEAQGGRLVELTINDEPEMNDDARTVVVRALRNDNNLRYRAWVERNRQYVKEQSGGRVGYIYVPNTGVDGQNELIRQFTSQKHKDALIIDERWNGGGQIPTRFVEVLDRPISSFFALRHGNPWVVPDYAHHGPKAMLINGRSGSGGDMFPFLFRQAGLGPLIGQRTWGGLVGISYNPHVVDLAFLAVPRFAFYELDGTWGIEGFGVAPDIPVTADPALLAGDTGRTEVLRDPQLDRAIKEMLDELDRNPPVKVVPPPKGPNRSGMGIDPRDR